MPATLSRTNSPRRSPIKRRIGQALALIVAAAAIWAWVVATPDVAPLPVLDSPRQPKLWSFGFVGDTQNGAGVVEPIFAAFARERVEFVLHLGDLVENAESPGQWSTLIAEADRHNLRLLPVVGNHDKLREYGDSGGIRFRQFFPGLPDTYYHVSHRGLNFVMLNSEQSLAPLTAQGHFLGWHLKHHPGTTIVCLHRPVFTRGERDLANQWLRRLTLHGRLAESDAVLVLAGHHHYYDRTHSLDGITYVVSGGGSRKLYSAEPEHPHSARFVSGVNHFGMVDVYSNQIEIRVLGVDGHTIDGFAIGLRRPVDPPGTNRHPWGHELGAADGRPTSQLWPRSTTDVGTASEAASIASRP